MTTITGDGEYVNVYSAESEHPDDIDAGYVGGQNLMLQKYEDVRDLVTRMSGDITDQLETLEELYASAILPDGWQDRLRNVVIGPVTQISRGALPTRPTLNLPDDWPDADDAPILGFLKPVPDVDLSYTEPTLPDQVDPDLNYVPEVYSSAILSPLFDKIYDVLVNGGTGLDSDVEDDIWTRASERQRRERAISYQKMMDATSADGFDFAAGAQAAILLAVDGEWAQQQTNLNGEIAIKQAELAYQATKDFALMGMDLEKIFRQFYSDTENRSLESKKVIAQFVLEKYQVKVTAYKTQWDGIKIGIEAKMAAVDVIVKQNDAMVRKFEGEMSAYQALIDLMAKKISALVEGYKGEVTGYAAAVYAEEKWWTALTEEQRTMLEADKLEMQKEVEEIKALVEATVALNGMKERISEAIANITAQVLASALTAIHTSLSHATSKSESLQEGWSHSDSLSESHSFDETAT